MDIGLQIGDVLQLEPRGEEAHYRVRLIGLVPERSLLVTAPEVGRERVVVQEGQEFTVRTYSHEEALAFETGVQRVCTQPYPYLHLRYPETFGHAIKRQTQRARVHLKGTVRRDDETAGRSVNVGIGDLSTEGAMLWCDDPLGQIGDSLILHMSLDPSGAAPLELSVDIRNIFEQAPGQMARWRYGVEFTFLPHAVAEAIKSYVNRKLGKSRW